jgi:hypothetical protein
VQLLNAFRLHAEVYYRKPDGTPTSELNTIAQAMRVLREKYGRTAVADFDVLCLKAVRDAMIAKGWCRSYVNKQISRLKTIFGWAVGNKMAPESLHHALMAVKGLKRGRSEANERARILPVPEETVAATRCADRARRNAGTGRRRGPLAAVRFLTVLVLH